MNSENKRAKVLIKAIESNNGIDADKLAEALQKPKKTAREILNGRLLRGCIFSFIGLALCIIGIVSLCTGSEFSSDPVTVPLIFGGASIAIGLSYLVVYFVTRKEGRLDILGDELRCKSSKWTFRVITERRSNCNRHLNNVF